VNYRNVILCGDVLARLAEMPDESVHCCVTSPPYWGLRDYGTPGQLGLEATPEQYIANMVAVFREVRRVLRKDGTLWLNMGDSYIGGGRGFREADSSMQATNYGSLLIAPTRGIAGLKPKDLVGQPWRVAFALQADSWWLRSDIIWSKPNPMPESVTDRPTKAHEYLFLLAKSERYYYDQDAIREPLTAGSAERYAYTFGGAKHSHQRADDQSFYANRTRPVGELAMPAGRNKRTVWEIATEPFPEAHFATFPTELVKPCILAGTSEHGCCAECGAPWVRVVEREFHPQEDVAHSQALYKAVNGVDPSSGWGGVPRGSIVSHTTGWRPSCKHEAPTQPCLVLDPFMGSGTTALVAARVGRDYVGIELNPDYVEMARERVGSQGRLL